MKKQARQRKKREAHFHTFCPYYARVHVMESREEYKQMGTLWSLRLKCDGNTEQKDINYYSRLGCKARQHLCDDLLSFENVCAQNLPTFVFYLFFFLLLLQLDTDQLISEKRIGNVIFLASLVM